jgi:SAM-dependent methyltransferase
VFTIEFWEKAWQDAAAGDAAVEIERSAAEVWNRRAASYEADTGQERVKEALAFLDNYGVLEGRLKVLDLGCGPGAFTEAFAERGHQVVALDPAEKMLEKLEARLAARPELKPLVRPVLADWVPLRLEEYGWDGYFDLVFASMTPAVRDAAMLRKTMQAAAGCVYLSRFAGPRLQPSVDAVWQKFSGRQYYRQSLDIYYVLNWLYAGGWRPVAHYSRWEREHRQPVGEAVATILDVLAMRLEVDGRVAAAVEEYVAARSQDGYFAERKGATSGMLLWDVGKKILPLVKK